MGSGRPLLFVHGTPTSHADWLELMRPLSHHRQCLALDHLGFGQSDRPPQADYRVAAHARRLEEWVTKQGLIDFDLVVHDFGGPIALPLLSHPHLRIGRIILINTWMWPLTDHASLRPALNLAASPIGRWLYQQVNFSPRILMPMAFAHRKNLDARMHREVMNAFSDKSDRVRVLWALAHALKTENDFFRMLWGLRENLLQHPVMLAWGLKDKALASVVLERWRTLSQGSSLQPWQISTYADAGHWPQFEATSSLLEDIRTFLGE